MMIVLPEYEKPTKYPQWNRVIFGKTKIVPFQTILEA